jgi:hypothetical protein
VALILILSGFIETLDTVKSDATHLRARVGHGVIILGLVKAFSSLPAVIDGIERWLKVADAKKERRRLGSLPVSSENTPDRRSQS